MDGNFLYAQSANNIFVNESGDSGVVMYHVVATENQTKTYFDQNMELIRRKVKADVDHQLEEKLITLKEPISKESVKYVDYDYILNVLKPKFWFSSFLPDTSNKGIRFVNKLGLQSHS